MAELHDNLVSLLSLLPKVELEEVSKLVNKYLEREIYLLPSIILSSYDETNIQEYSNITNKYELRNIIPQMREGLSIDSQNFLYHEYYYHELKGTFEIFNIPKNIVIAEIPVEFSETVHQMDTNLFVTFHKPLDVKSEYFIIIFSITLLPIPKISVLHKFIYSKDILRIIPISYDYFCIINEKGNQEIWKLSDNPSMDRKGKYEITDTINSDYTFSSSGNGRIKYSVNDSIVVANVDSKGKISKVTEIEGKFKFSFHFLSYDLYALTYGTKMKVYRIFRKDGSKYESKLIQTIHAYENISSIHRISDILFIIIPTEPRDRIVYKYSHKKGIFLESGKFDQYSFVNPLLPSKEAIKELSEVFGKYLNVSEDLLGIIVKYI